jgi:hypothetical protein
VPREVILIPFVPNQGGDPHASPGDSCITEHLQYASRNVKLGGGPPADGKLFALTGRPPLQSPAATGRTLRPVDVEILTPTPKQPLPTPIGKGQPLPGRARDAIVGRGASARKRFPFDSPGGRVYPTLEIHTLPVPAKGG